MFTRRCQLLLRVRIRDSEAADPVHVFFAVLFFLDSGPFCSDRTSVLARIESQVHAAIKQIGENVFRLAHFFIVFGLLGFESREVQCRLVFRALLGYQFLIVREILSRGIHIGHRFIQQSQLPIIESKIRRKIF